MSDRNIILHSIPILEYNITAAISEMPDKIRCQVDFYKRVLNLY